MENLPPPTRPPLPLAPLLPAIPPTQVWTSLTASQQRQVRQTLLIICQHLLLLPHLRRFRMTLPNPPAALLSVPSKITPAHLERLACIYVRQSSWKQVEQHREGQLYQAQLAERARPSAGARSAFGSLIRTSVSPAANGLPAPGSTICWPNFRSATSGLSSATMFPTGPQQSGLVSCAGSGRRLRYSDRR